MKLKKIVASAVAAALSVSAVAVAASAYDIPSSKQILTWSAAVEIKPEDFPELAELSKDKPYLVFEVASAPSPDIHVMKPFIIPDYKFMAEEGLEKYSASLGGEDPANPGFESRSFRIASNEGDEEKFSTDKIIVTVPESMIDGVKTNGFAIMGAGGKVTKVTVSGEAPTVYYDIDGKEIKDEAPVTTAGDSTPTTSAAAGDVNQPTTDKNSPDTGVEGVAVVAGIAVIAAGALVISKKRK